MKTGILTFHRCINYGSYWQVRCLAGYLQLKGIETEIMDHYSGRVNFAEWKCALQPVLPLPVPLSDRSLYRKKIEKFSPFFDSLPLSHSFPLDSPSQSDYYDLIIVGSDEVWNLSHPWYGNCPLFFGDGLNAGRLISYAASFGNYDASARLDKVWSEKLTKFDRISVRDENSMIIIKNALRIVPEIVLDPCLLFPGPIKNAKKTEAKKYAAVYGHNFTDYFIREVRNWSRYSETRLISIGYRNDWADEQWIAADPGEFASFMAGSTAIITNFFHGCIFALINAKPFICGITSYRSIKIQNLMKLLDGEKHIAYGNVGFQVYLELLSEPPEEKILRNVDIMRNKSAQWLDESLLTNIPVYNERSLQS